MLALPRLALLFVACRGETQAHISPGQHDGARRRLGLYNKFKCDLKNEYALRIGVVGDADYVGRLNGEEGFTSVIREMVKGASRAFENNFGFTLDLAHIVLPSDFQHLPNSFLHASCKERNTDKRLRDLNHFRATHLSDKPAALWLMWTACLSNPGAVSFVGNLCTTTSPVAVMISVSNVRKLAHEIGHAIGAMHPNYETAGDVMDSARSAADYTIEGIRFLEFHSSSVCDVIDHSLGRKPISQIFGRKRNNAEMDKNLCWKRVAGDNDVGGAPTTTSVRPTTRRPTRRPATQGATYKNIGQGLCIHKNGGDGEHEWGNHPTDTCQNLCTSNKKCGGYNASKDGKRCRFVLEAPTDLKVGSLGWQNSHCMTKQAPTTTSVRPTPTRPTRRPATQDCTDVWAEKCRWRKWDCSYVKNVQKNCRRTCGLCGDSATQRSAKNQEGDSGGIDVVAIVAGVCAGTVVLGLAGALFCAFVRKKTREMPRE